MKEPQQPAPASSFQWSKILTNPVTVVFALWAFVPLGIGLFLLNPVIRKDGRWWAGVAVWGLYLLWVGRLPLVNSRDDDTVAIEQEESWESGSMSDADARKKQAAAFGSGDKQQAYELMSGTKASQAVSRIRKGMRPTQVRSICVQGGIDSTAVGLGQMWIVTFRDDSSAMVTFDRHQEVMIVEEQH